MKNLQKNKLIKRIFKNKILGSIILIFNIFYVPINAQKIVTKKDSLSFSKKDTIVVPKERLRDILFTKAENIRTNPNEKMTYLTKKAQIKYFDMQIDADYISVDWDGGMIYARGKVDSLGEIIEPAITTQAGKQYEFNEVSFNTKTRQAIAYNARTEESEGVIVANKTKKYNDSVFVMRKGRYTTDTYFIDKKSKEPDYHLSATYLKLVKGEKSKQVISGPIRMFIEEVPTPLILPFAILPFSDKRSAGLIIPSFGERSEVGFFFNGLGYYQPIGKHLDFKILTDYYTKGSWNIRPEANYRKKYKYSGNFSAEIGQTVRGIKGLDDYSKSATYRVAWRHTQDQKANPLFNFSASVNYTSSKFYNNTINNNYIYNQSVLNAQQNSNISFTKRFLNLPVTITGGASYSQNFSTGVGSLRLPEVNVAINQFYLFKPKNGIREGLLENINVNTGFKFTNSANLEEGELFKKAMWDKMQTGLTNRINLATNATIAKYFTFSLGANVNNALTTKVLDKKYNPITNEVESNFNKKIAGFSTFSTSGSLQTTLYKVIPFKKGSKIMGIRHVMSPSLGFTYSPDFGDEKFGYYKSYYDANGAITPYSIFSGSVVGSPSIGETAAINFNIANNLEMKLRSEKDSIGSKKIKIFESLNLSGNYNFAAKKHKWSIFSLSGQSSFFKQKLRVNTSLSIDPYRNYFEEGSDTRIRTEDFGHFSIQGFNIQMNYPLSDIIFGEKEELNKKYSRRGEVRNEVYYFDDDGYARFNQPWNLNINAQYSYNRTSQREATKVASLGLNGNIKLTPYWDINGSAQYDFVTKKLAYTRLGFSRDQRSFTINFNWVPFGRYKVYDFFIGIRANILSDALKYRDRSFPSNSAF